MSVLRESYEPEIQNGIYNNALMNLDDVRKSLPKNTPKEILNLYQQLFDALENENVNNIINDSDEFTIFIQAVDPFDSDYQELKKFEGRTFHLDNVQKIDKIEQERLGVEDCEYCGFINFEGHELPIPFSKDVVNSKKPYSYQWIYACFIKYKIQENKINKYMNNKQELYENIMSKLAEVVKASLNEDVHAWRGDYDLYNFNHKRYDEVFQQYINEGKIKLHPSVLNAIEDAKNNDIDWEEYELPNGDNLNEFMIALFTYNTKISSVISRLDNVCAREFFGVRGVGQLDIDIQNEFGYELLMALPYSDWSNCKPDNNLPSTEDNIYDM